MKHGGFQIALFSLAMVGGSFVLCGPASAQSADESFAKEAASGGMAEVKLGQLAENKGNNPATKEFGKKMVTAHSKAGEQLKGVASKNKVIPPSQMSRSDQATYDRLSKLSGTEFDKAYAEDMQKDVAAFQNYSNEGKNPDIKQFASETLPALQDPLKMAHRLD
jgi:putative membrane protein